MVYASIAMDLDSEVNDATCTATCQGGWQAERDVEVAAHSVQWSKVYVNCDRNIAIEQSLLVINF